MNANRTRVFSLSVCGVVAGTAGLASGGGGEWRPTFGLDINSPTIQMYPGFDNSDLYAPGAFGSPPVKVLKGAFVGLNEGWPFDGRAHSMGGVAEVLYFSVDRRSEGLPRAGNDVDWQWWQGHQASDIFTSDRDGTNRMVVNQADWGMLPALSPTLFAPSGQDNIMSLDLQPGELGLPTIGDADIVYNLDTINEFGVSGADILAPGVGIIVGYADLGLRFDDDIDALHVDNGTVYFSLKWDSPSAEIFGLSGADVFIAFRNGVFFEWASAESLGLHEFDEIDALSFARESGLGCVAADVAEPFGVMDMSDLTAFIVLFIAGDPRADLNRNGLLDLADINLFVSSFLGGCP